jgi:alpha-beta hydrolase superfamily lysophospholipase
VLLHGLGEHSGRYDHLGRALAAAGRTTWALDHRGHGRSEGRRANIERLEWAVADVGRLVDRLGGTVVLFGHSMGGAIAAVYASTNPAKVRALVLSGPALHLVTRPAWQVWPVRALAAVAPGAGIGGVGPKGLSHDPDVLDGFRADPLNWHGRPPARTAVEIYRAGCQAVPLARQLKVPLLMVHGEDDPIVPVASSRAYFAEVGSPDKELYVLPGMLHEPHQELGKEPVIAHIVEWVLAH